MDRAAEIEKLWGAARGVRACGLRGAAWLAGEHVVFPDYFGDCPAKETGPLVEVLAEINRAGFFTTNSQPGGALQRAHVSGLMPRDVADQWVDALRREGLIVLTADASESAYYDVAVTRRDDGSISTWAGRFIAIDDELDELPMPGLDALCADAVQVDVIDDWGDGSRLFDTVRRVVAAG